MDSKQESIILISISLLCLLYLIESIAKFVCFIIFSICYLKLFQLNSSLIAPKNHSKKENTLHREISFEIQKSNSKKGTGELIKKELLDHFPSGILICKVKQKHIKFIYMNKYLQNIIGVHSDHDKNTLKHLKKFVYFNREKHSSTKLNVYKNLYEYIHTLNSTESFSKISKFSDEEKHILVISKDILPEDKPEIYYKIISVQNISEDRKYLMANLYRNLKSQYLLTISHELNNPLNGLLHYNNKILSSQNLSHAKKIKYTEQLKKFKFCIKFFIKNLILFSKIVLKDKINMCPSHVSLGPLLKSIILKFEVFFDYKKIKYKSDISNSFNVVLYFDYEYLKFFLKNVFMYVSFKIDQNKNFKFETEVFKDKKILKFNFYKQESNKIIYKYLSYSNKEMENSQSDDINVDKSVKTEEMLREIIDTLAKSLKINLVHIPDSKLFLSFECKYFDIDNGSEEENIEEFSNETFSKKFMNINKVKRTLQLETSFIDSAMNFNIKEPSRRTSKTVVHNTPRSIPIKLNKPKCDMDLESESPKHSKFFDREGYQKEIDKSGILKIEELSKSKIRRDSRDLKSNPMGISLISDSSELLKDKESLIMANDTENKRESRKSIFSFVQNSSDADSHSIELKQMQKEKVNKNKESKFINKRMSNEAITPLRSLVKRVTEMKKYIDEDDIKYIRSLRNRYNRITNSKRLSKKIHLRYGNLTIVDDDEIEDDGKIKTSENISPNSKLKLTPLDSEVNASKSTYTCLTSIFDKNIKNNDAYVGRKFSNPKRSETKIIFTIKDEKLLKPFQQTIRSKSNSSNCNCKNILIVDDESFNITTMKHILKSYKLIPDFAYNGQEAIEKVKANFTKTCCEERYKLIFMDIMMPILDGIEASIKIQSLAEQYKIQKLAIIIVSANDIDVVYQRIKGISLIKNLVSKPIKKSKIDEILNKYFFEC